MRGGGIPFTIYRQEKVFHISELRNSKRLFNNLLTVEKFSENFSSRHDSLPASGIAFFLFDRLKCPPVCENGSAVDRIWSRMFERYF